MTICPDTGRAELRWRGGRWGATAGILAQWPPRSGYRLTSRSWASDVAGLAHFARAAERAGIARLWAPELYRSATVPLAVAAAATERIGLGTGIALAFTRSPMVMALEALDLDELSGGRLVSGLAPACGG